jgi:hypothetical protein
MTIGCRRVSPGGSGLSGTSGGVARQFNPEFHAKIAKGAKACTEFRVP